MPATKPLPAAYHRANGNLTLHTHPQSHRTLGPRQLTPDRWRQHGRQDLRSRHHNAPSHSPSAVVDATQVGFLPGRLIGDNILAHTKSLRLLGAQQRPRMHALLGLLQGLRLRRSRLDPTGHGSSRLHSGRPTPGSTVSDGHPRPRTCERRPKLHLSRHWRGCPQGNPISPLSYILQSRLHACFCKKVSPQTASHRPPSVHHV